MGKPFKMKGHTLPGINQRSEGNTDLPDGRSGSAAFQYKDSPAKHPEDPHTPHHEMTGQVNKDKTRVVNEKGNWVGIGDRPDLVKKGEKKSPNKIYDKPKGKRTEY
jgi:hypothetical protein